MIDTISGIGFDYDKFQNNGSTIFQYSGLDEEVSGLYVAEAKNPVIYRLHKRGELEYLWLGGWSETRFIKGLKEGPFKIEALGTWIDANGFEHGNSGNGGKIIRPEPIQIQVRFSDDLTLFYATVTVVDKETGVLVSDERLYEAPESEYQSQVQFSEKIFDRFVDNRPKGISDKMKYLYVRGPQGQFYSRVELQISTTPYDSILPQCRSEIVMSGRVYANPMGRRNLEYDRQYNDEIYNYRRSIMNRRGKEKYMAKQENREFDENAFIQKIREEEKQEKLKQRDK